MQKPECLLWVSWPRRSQAHGARRAHGAHGRETGRSQLHMRGSCQWVKKKIKMEIIKLQSQMLERGIIMMLSVSAGQRRSKVHKVLERNLVCSEVCNPV